MIRATLLGLALLGLAACETTRGATRDLEKAGHAINSAVKEIRKDIRKTF